jgi:hypothetical protein
MTVIVILLICFASRSSHCHTDTCVPNAFSFTIVLMAVLLVGGRHSSDSFFCWYVMFVLCQLEEESHSIAVVGVFVMFV